jgi:hypothetical protein
VALTQPEIFAEELAELGKDLRMSADHPVCESIRSLLLAAMSARDIPF